MDDAQKERLAQFSELGRQADELRVNRRACELRIRERELVLAGAQRELAECDLALAQNLADTNVLHREDSV